MSVIKFNHKSYNILNGIGVISLNSPNIFYIEMGKRIVACRRQLNISQEDLAEQTGLSVQAISTAERGTKALRPDNLLKISRTLGVSADYLLSGETTEDNLQFSAIADKLKLLSEEQVQAVLTLIDVIKK